MRHRARAALTAATVVATTMALTIAVSGSGPVSAAAAGSTAPNGKIAFSVTGGGKLGEIWTVNRDGTDPHALTTGHDDHNPSYSPTGQQIAFTRYDGATVSEPPDYIDRFITVWVMNADGSGAHQLKHNKLATASGPYGWSANGQQVYAFGHSLEEVYDSEAPPSMWALGVGGGERRVHLAPYDDQGCSNAGLTSPGGHTLSLCNNAQRVDGHTLNVSPGTGNQGLDVAVWANNDGQLLLNRGSSGLNRSNVLYTVPASGGAAAAIDKPHRITTNLQAGLEDDGVTVRPAGCTFDDAFVLGSPAMAPGGELVATQMIATNDPETRVGRCPDHEFTGFGGAFGVGTVSADGQTWKMVYSSPDQNVEDQVSLQCTPGNCLTGIIVEKVPNAPGGGTFPTTFHYTASTGAGSVTGSILADGDLFSDPPTIMLRVPAGTTTVTETPATDWHLDEISCDPAATSTNLAGGSVTVDMQEGDVVFCSFISTSTSFADRDNDGVTDIADDCPDVANVDQLDTNGDGVGDACELDTPDPPLPPRKHIDNARCMVAVTGLNECTLKPGDIIVDRSDDSKLKYLHLLGGTWWTHAAIVVHNPLFGTPGDHLENAVVEAVAEGTLLHEFQTSVASEQADVTAFAVIRPLVPISIRNAAAAFAVTQVGKPYSPHGFPHPGAEGTGPNAYYCSGLVWKAYKVAGVDLADGSNPTRDIFPIISPDRIAETNPGGSIERAVIQGHRHSGLVDVAGPVQVLLTDADGHKYGTDPTGTFFTDIPDLRSDPPPTDGPHVSWAVSNLAADWTLTLTNGAAATTAVVSVDYAGNLRAIQGQGVPLKLAANETKTFTLGSFWHQPPIAAITATVTGNRSVDLDASGSTPGSAAIVNYAWDFEGDGVIDQVTNGPTTSHTYPSDVEAAYQPIVRVRDTSGAIASQGALSLFAYNGKPLRHTDVLTAVIDTSTDPAPATLTVDGFGASGVTWNFGDGSDPVDTAGGTTTHDFAAGVYTVTATDQADATRDVQAVVHAAAPTAAQAQPDEITAAPGEHVWLDPLNNDADPDHVLDPSSVNPFISSDNISFNSPGGGLLEVVVSANAPAGDQTGGYQVCDATTACSSADVTVHVDPTINQPPLATLQIAADGSGAPAVVGLDASGSTDPNGDALSYHWDFDGDGVTDQTTQTPKVNHLYADAGSAVARVTVVDPDQAESTATAMVVVPLAGTVPDNPGPTVAHVSLAASSLTAPVVVTLSEDADHVSTTSVLLRATTAGGTSPVAQATQVCRTVNSAVVSCATGPVRSIELRPRTPVAGQKFRVAITSALTDVGGHAATPTTAPTLVRASLSEQESSVAGTPIWSSVSTGKASGGSYWAADRRGAAAERVFTGTSITWLTVTGKGFGRADVYLDGKRKTAGLSLYSASTAYKVARTYGGLSNSLHVVKIVVLGAKGGAAGTGTTVAIDGFKVGSSTAQAPTRFWSRTTSSAASAGKVAVSDGKGYTYSFVFRGTGIAWWTLLGKGQGKATVTIDGVSRGTYDGYATSTMAKARSFGGLTDKTHTIVIRVVRAHHAGATGFQVTVDRFVVT